MKLIQELLILSESNDQAAAVKNHILKETRRAYNSGDASDKAYDLAVDAIVKSIPKILSKDSAINEVVRQLQLILESVDERKATPRYIGQIDGKWSALVAFAEFLGGKVSNFVKEASMYDLIEEREKIERDLQKLVYKG